MNRAANFVGVDLGGTKLSVARLVDGTLSEPQLVPTSHTDSEGLIGEIVAGIDAVRNSDTVAVGVGIPSVVDFAAGRARASVNVPFKDISIRDVLADRLGLPVHIDNDATVAALAEAHDGREFVVENLVMFTVGTGVGGGLVLNGQVYRGATGGAAELGHTLIGLDLATRAPEPAGFPQPGSLESLASGTTLDELARQAAREHPASALGELAASGKKVSGPQAVEAAQQGDDVARRVLRLLGERLGVGIANAINTFDPDVVAIGGGASAAGDLLLEPARETAKKFVLPGVGERTEIRLARHGQRAGVRGAALLAALEYARQHP